MITGQMPFEQETPSDVIAAILKTDPPPLSSLAPDVPLELKRIVEKALEKNREERYQGIKDMDVDLRRLKKHLDFESELESLDSSRAVGVTRTKDSAAYGPRAAYGRIHRSTATQAEHITSSAEYIVSNIRKHKWTASIVLVVLVVVVTGLGYGVAKLTSRGAPPFQV